MVTKIGVVVFGGWERAVKQEVVVLRHKNPVAKRSFEDLRRAAPRTAGLESATLESAPKSAETPSLDPAGLEIVVEEVSASERVRLARDPHTLTSAPRILISQIAPSWSGEFVRETTKTAWGVEAVGAADSQFDGSGVRVGVIDSGIDEKHSAFGGVDLTMKDFSGSQSMLDADGHGTHCAGTIFGREVDGIRIGVAPGVKQASIAKIFGGPGAASTSQALGSALLWCFDQACDVISLSLTFNYLGDVERVARQRGVSEAHAASIVFPEYIENLRLVESIVELCEAQRRRTVFVAAAGNDSEAALLPAYLPAIAHKYFAIAAVDEKFRRAPFSNSGTYCAPGVKIPSAKSGGGLISKSGTSMACPHVAGVAALWHQKAAGMRDIARFDANPIYFWLQDNVRRDIADVSDTGPMTLAPKN